MTYTKSFHALPADVRARVEARVGKPPRPMSTMEVMAAMGQEIVAERERCAQLVAFAKDMLSCAWEGGDADGGYIQDQAEKYGLIREVVFDSTIHRDSNGYAQDGDRWYEFAGPLSAPPAGDETE